MRAWESFQACYTSDKPRLEFLTSERKKRKGVLREEKTYRLKPRMKTQTYYPRALPCTPREFIGKHAVHCLRLAVPSALPQSCFGAVDEVDVRPVDAVRQRCIPVPEEERKMTRTELVVCWAEMRSEGRWVRKSWSRKGARALIPNC